MPDDHPSGNPDLIRQHKHKQRIGDKELDEKSRPSEGRTDKPPTLGKGKPDAEEGVGTVQNQKR
jgi:hypothetical protein